MKALQAVRVTAIGIAMLGSSVVVAEELPLPTDPVQQREKMLTMGSEERAAYHEQLQERMRNMMPEEQQLMRETRSSGRDHTENEQAEGARQRSRDGARQGLGAGSGHGMDGGMGAGRGCS